MNCQAEALVETEKVLSYFSVLSVGVDGNNQLKENK